MTNFRLSAADFLIDSAFTHYAKTALEVKAFIVPPELFDEIALEPDSVKTGEGRLKFAGTYLVFSMKNTKPYLVDVRNTKYLLSRKR